METNPSRMETGLKLAGFMCPKRNPTSEHGDTIAAINLSLRGLSNSCPSGSRSPSPPLPPTQIPCYSHYLIKDTADALTGVQPAGCWTNRVGQENLPKRPIPSCYHCVLNVRQTLNKANSKVTGQQQMTRVSKSPSAGEPFAVSTSLLAELFP